MRPNNVTANIQVICSQMNEDYKNKQGCLWQTVHEVGIILRDETYQLGLCGSLPALEGFQVT